MNDDLESELKMLRPVPASPRLLACVEKSLAAVSSPPENVIAPRRFQINWLTLGVGLAAAACLVVFARHQAQILPDSSRAVASTPATGAPALPANPVLNRFVPRGLTQVVYQTRNEGLIFPVNSPAPMRRLRKEGRETLHWRNPETGASIRVSYPSEEIELHPISGQ